MKEIAGQRPLPTRRERVDPLNQLNQTLAEHYSEKKPALYAFETPKTYDRDWRGFSPPTRGTTARRPRRASSRRHRSRMRELVSKWTGEYQLTVDAILDRNDIAMSRTRPARGRFERKLVADFTVLLTAKTVHALFGPLRERESRYEAIARPGAGPPGPDPPESSKGYTEQEINVWKTEYDVVSTLRASGHDVRPLGVKDELKPIREQIDSWKPHVVFSLLEEFHGEVIYDQHVASYLELIRVPYTGCNPRGLMLARGKDLSKTLVHYHRISVPAFAVFPMRRKFKRPKRLAMPLIVKSLNEDASYGISQASASTPTQSWWSG